MSSEASITVGERLQSVYEEITGTYQELQWGDSFVDLEECSPDYQRSYKNAMKAIDHNSLRKFKDSIENLKKYAGTRPGSKSYLDVFYAEDVVSFHQKKHVFFYMGLLSYACVNGQKDMVNELLKPEIKASIDIGNGLSGTPLTQVLTYAMHHNCSDKVDKDILKHLTIGTRFNMLVICYVSDHDWMGLSPVELAISIKRIDIAGLLISAGANPIHISDVVKGVPQLLHEYFEFGTNQFITWLLHQHLLSGEVPQFIERAVKLDIFNSHGVAMFSEVGRHPAHALLTCGNEEMVAKFLQEHGKQHLTVKDSSGRTAMQIATERGDLESVEILLKYYDDKEDDESGGSQQNKTERTGKRATVSKLDSFKNEDDIHDEVDTGKSKDDGSGDQNGIMTEDLDSALLAAARNGDIKIVRSILKKIDVFNAFRRNETIRDLAYKEGLTTLFEVLEDSVIYELFTLPDSDGNTGTVVHNAALTGNAKLFKVFFPLQPVDTIVRSTDESEVHDYKRQITDQLSKARFKALTLENDEGKTPLHLAIENNQICILKTLPECIKERDSHTGTEQNKEKISWEGFWKEWGPQLFIHACSYGTVDSVKVLLETDKKSNRCVLSNNSAGGVTPLSAAAENGRAEILHYLLHDCKLTDTSSSTELSPLFLAAENGHAECVSVLLKKGFDITLKRKDGYNCLMIATERKHSDTALVILSHKKGFDALRCKKDRKKDSVTPMRMLIEHLPDAAEWVLNRCVLEQSSAEGKEQSGLTNEYEFLEDFTHQFIGTWRRHSGAKSRKQTYLIEEDPIGEDQMELDPINPEESVDFPFFGEGKRARDDDWRLHKYKSSNHTIKLMVDHNREKLLNHVLVKSWIKYKWRKIGLPILFFSFGVHILFLFLLTAFAWVLPRPGPSCPMEFDNSTDSIDNSNETCVGVNTHKMRFLYSSATIMIIFCAYYLLLELFQLIRRGVRKYFIDPDNPLQNYYQLVTYTSVIIFVSPVSHICWCFPSWKWQIGALAVFLAWINNFILLKHVPHVGNPVTMLFNIYLNFIKLMYLPILLILTFAFPFYMLFIATEEGGEMILTNFLTPFHSMWSLIIQTADGPDAEFFNENLAHRVVTYALFIVFIVAVPVLFNNFLIGMALGEIDDERKKAKLSLIKLKVDYIFESENSIPCFGGYRYTYPSEVSVKPHKLEQMKGQNEEKIKGVYAAMQGAKTK